MTPKTKTGTFLVPGPSKNGRLYTGGEDGNINRAVKRMQARLASGQTIPMHASHRKNAEGDTLATAAFVREASFDPSTNKGRFKLEYANTSAGREIEALGADLRTISIFGNWVGEKTTTSEGYETAPDLDVSSIDFTHRPGVSDAQLDESLAEFATASGSAVWESFDEGFTDVGTIEDDDAPRPSALALLEAEMKHPLVDGVCTACTEEAKAHADHNYRRDGVKRFPIDTAEHVRSSWVAVGRKLITEAYSPAQVRRLKANVATAAKRLELNVAEEQAALSSTIEALAPELADVLEAYASTHLDNGQGDIRVSAYTTDPESLPALSKAVARSALAALLNLDPDNDGDVDLGDGADAPPGDGDAEAVMTCPACAAEIPAEAMYCPMCGQPVPGAEEAPAEQEGAHVPNDPTASTSEAKKYTLEQVKTLIGEPRHPLLAEGQDEFTAEELVVLLSTPAPAVAPEAPTEESELDKARRLVAEADAAAADKPVTAAEIAEMLTEREEKLRKEVREELIEEQRRSGGGPVRRGISEADAKAVTESDFERDSHKLAEMTDAELRDQLNKGIGHLLPA